MADQLEKNEEWWVTVHTTRRGPFPNGGAAYAVARTAKRDNPNFHVAVIDPQGHSTSVDW